MKRQATIDNKTITYELKRSFNRRTIGLKVDQDGLTVIAPYSTSESQVAQALNAKANWILNALGRVKSQLKAIQWQDGTTFPFQGRDCQLRIVEDFIRKPKLSYEDGILTIETLQTDNTSITLPILKWLHNQAFDILSTKLENKAKAMGATYARFGLSNAQGRWGSCTSKGNIRLNWRLILTAPPLADYVIVHELAHLEEMNHSPRFWSIVEAWCPNWKSMRKRLNAEGPKLFQLFPH